MIITIHQPEYLPYLGFFDRIFKSDIFVILDHVQYQKHGYINRNRIKNANGAEWLTIPVNKKMKLDTICKVEIRNDENWRDKHRKSISMNYSKAPYFEKYFPIFEELYSKNWQYISELDTYLIAEILQKLGMNKKIYKSSELDIQEKSTDMLVEICKKLNGTTYLSGEGGKLYMECDKFENAGIKLNFQTFTHPVYTQLHEKVGFLPYMSFIDLLFNHGENSLEILNSKG